ncbi:sugar kinase [Plantactinospora sp. GCM10030261]|uniref:sugar kinase n=1 Tax=Plantactinospora sp. GCM10030261 TaxID=3273420 RepID=UPI00361D03A6
MTAPPGIAAGRDGVGDPSADRPGAGDRPAEVVAVGEVMGLLDPAGEGPLEDAGRLTLRIAGAEANVLIGLSRLGHRTRLISAVGTDPFGRLIVRTLRREGVAVDQVYRDASAPTGVFFKERYADGHRRVYYYRTGSAAARLSPDHAGLDRLAAPAVLVVSGLSLALGRPDGLSSVVRQAIRHFAARGTRVVFDPNVRSTLWDGEVAAKDFAELLPYLHVVLAGREELAILVPGATPDQAAQALCDGGLRAVVTKDGARGATLHDRDGVTAVPPFPVDRAVDPVGAGDAFAAGVVCGLLRGWPLRDAARLGAVLGAAAVTSTGDWEAMPVEPDPLRLLRRYERLIGDGRGDEVDG